MIVLEVYIFLLNAVWGAIHQVALFNFYGGLISTLALTACAGRMEIKRGLSSDS